MHNRLPFAVAVGLLLQVSAIAGPVPRGEAEAAARRFCRAIVRHGGYSYWEFEGEARQQMKPLLSKRLLANLDNTHICVRDWARYQPPHSTDKPPGVDCCIFSASADWLPTTFALQDSTDLPDGRRRVTIEYRYDSPKEHGKWHVAVYIVKEGQRYVVDDFEGGLDEWDSGHWFTTGEDPECQDGKWVGSH